MTVRTCSHLGAAAPTVFRPCRRDSGLVRQSLRPSACTGLPRKDYDWLFEFKGATPASVMRTLGGMQPTTKLGDLFQYSNLMAAAAGYLAGHAVSPGTELGAAYDEAM